MPRQLELGHLFPKEKQFIVNMYKQILNIKDRDAKTIFIVSKIIEVKQVIEGRNRNSSLAFNFYVHLYNLNINKHANVIQTHIGLKSGEFFW